MTEYWKSNERKYCDFCKCWITDNKASVAFHEDGKRHKAAVAKRITDISASSAKSERERQKMDADIRKMEEAAMRSYAQDIHSRGDMTARNINTVLAAAANTGPMVGVSVNNDSHASTSQSKTKTRQIDPLRLPGNSDDEEEGKRVGITKVAPESVPNASLWVEGKTDEGYTYYWNVKSNESVWKAPKEGYLSYAEYERINEIAVKQQEFQQAAEAKKFRENVNEEVAKYNRERLKQFRPRETAEEKEAKRVQKNSFKTEEQAATQEIGAWQVVQQKPAPEPVDWELPTTNYHYVAPVVTHFHEEPPVKRFKEKTIETLNDDATVGVASTFKKRKFSAKGNARQRLDDD